VKDGRPGKELQFLCAPRVVPMWAVGRRRQALATAVNGIIIEGRTRGVERKLKQYQLVGQT